MKKTVMCIIGAMMILSLAACTPTSEKNKTGEVKQTEAAVKPTKDSGPGVVTDRMPDLEAPDMEIISVYTVSEDGSKIEGTMDAVEEMSAQALVDLLIQYKVLDEGTTAVKWDAAGEPSSEEVGPGMVKIPGFEVTSNLKEKGTLELSQFPDSAQKDMKLQAVANTFIENMDVLYLTIKVDGEPLVENAQFVDAGK